MVCPGAPHMTLSACYGGEGTAQAWGHKDNSTLSHGGNDPATGRVGLGRHSPVQSVTASQAANLRSGVMATAVKTQQNGPWKHLPWWSAALRKHYFSSCIHGNSPQSPQNHCPPNLKISEDYFQNPESPVTTDCSLPLWSPDENHRAHG